MNTNAQLDALRAIAEWPITDYKNIDAVNMARVARAAQVAAQGAAERAVPAVEDVDLPDAEDMAHSAVQEALSFGLSHQVVHKWMRHIQDQTVKAMIAAAHATPAPHAQAPAGACTNCGDSESQHNGARCVNGKENSYFATAQAAPAPSQQESNMAAPAQDWEPSPIGAQRLAFSEALTAPTGNDPDGWVRFWLDGALRCDAFEWDPEQREMAEAQLFAAIDRAARAAAPVAAAPGVPSEAVKWWNGCDKTVPAALRYLADNDRPSGGEQCFNAMHLHQLADEIERMAKAPLYAAPQPATADALTALASDLLGRAARNEAPGNELYVLGLREAADAALAAQRGGA